MQNMRNMINHYRQARAGLEAAKSRSDRRGVQASSVHLRYVKANLEMMLDKMGRVQFLEGVCLGALSPNKTPWSRHSPNKGLKLAAEWLENQGYDVDFGPHTLFSDKNTGLYGKLEFEVGQMIPHERYFSADEVLQQMVLGGKIANINLDPLFKYAARGANVKLGDVASGRFSIRNLLNLTRRIVRNRTISIIKSMKAMDEERSRYETSEGVLTDQEQANIWEDPITRGTRSNVLLDILQGPYRESDVIIDYLIRYTNQTFTTRKTTNLRLVSRLLLQGFRGGRSMATSKAEHAVIAQQLNIGKSTVERIILRLVNDVYPQAIQQAPSGVRKALDRVMYVADLEGDLGVGRLRRAQRMARKALALDQGTPRNLVDLIL